MEKRATNTFVGGLNTDRHPLTSQNSELIDAQNNDLIQVGEGYQLILQKREGNTELMYDDGVNPPVPAGLDPDFIPLTVEEFNNLAYIISVNPTTGEGELGTFPSPDYSQFEYVAGDPIATVVDIDANIWDPLADTVGYSFTISEVGLPNNIVTGSGMDDIMPGDSPANTEITSARFDINNVGALADTFYIELSGDSTGIDIYADNVLYVPVSGILIGPGSNKTITFKLTDAFQTTPVTVNDVTATITPENGDIATAKTYDFSYHTTIVIELRRDGRLTQWWLPALPNDWVGDNDSISDTFIADPQSPANPYGPARYEWRSNLISNTIVLTNPVVATDIVGTDVPIDKAVGVSFLPNPGPLDRNAEFVLTGTGGGVNNILIIQLAP